MANDYITVGRREQEALDAIERVEQLGAEYGEARAAEQRMEDGRPEAKRSATARIMRSGDNILTQKPHSASSAEAIVETDPEYRCYRNIQSDLVVQKEVARGRFEAAILRARLAVTMAGEDA